MPHTTPASTTPAATPEANLPKQHLVKAKHLRNGRHEDWTYDEVNVHGVFEALEEGGLLQDWEVLSIWVNGEKVWSA